MGIKVQSQWQPESRVFCRPIFCSSKSHRVLFRCAHTEDRKIFWIIRTPLCALRLAISHLTGPPIYFWYASEVLQSVSRSVAGAPLSSSMFCVKRVTYIGPTTHNWTAPARARGSLALQLTGWIEAKRTQALSSAAAFARVGLACWWIQDFQ